jgi:hypothetical protein
LQVYRDTNDSNGQTTVHENTCYDGNGMYRTLGSSLCDANNPQSTPCECGPDWESGRGLLTSAFLDGEEWLIAAGSKKKGNLHYLYMSPEEITPLRMYYVDLRRAIPSGTATENASAFAVLRNRLYVGMQVDGPDAPKLVALTRTPNRPGLDATLGPTASSLDLRAGQTAIGGQGSGNPPASLAQVDAMLAFEDRQLYAANKEGCIASKTPTPSGPADFESCTPPVADWKTTSMVPPGKTELLPRDRAVPAIVEWKGRIYLARNLRDPAGAWPYTSGSGELWKCTPRRDGAGAPLPCTGTDWTRVATNLGRGTNTHVSALFASGAYLYLGFDNPTTGVQLFRTAAADPLDAAAFTGHLGCQATDPSCAPLGGAGMGDPSNVHVFDARALPAGSATDVWVTAGSGTGPARAYRLRE